MVFAGGGRRRRGIFMALGNGDAPGGGTATFGLTGLSVAEAGTIGGFDEERGESAEMAWLMTFDFHAV